MNIIIYYPYRDRAVPCFFTNVDDNRRDKAVPCLYNIIVIDLDKAVPCLYTDHDNMCTDRVMK